MNWQRAISALNIGEYLTHEQISVARLSANRFIVLKEGLVYDDHYSRIKVGFAIARALEAVTGQVQPAPCADCGAPREHTSYCNACSSRRAQESKHRVAAS